MYQSDVQSGADKHVVENTPGLAFRLHPLELSQHITLTPLQSAITTAILRCGEPSCHITTIYEFVARRWHKIRGKDGTNYATDYRKAVQTCLRHHANNIALFRVDPNDTKRWMLCATLSESEEAIRQEQERRARRSTLSGNTDPTKMTMSLRPRDDWRSEKSRKNYSLTRPRSIQHYPYSRYRSFSFSGGSDDDDDINNNNELSDDENMADVSDDLSKNSQSQGGTGNDDDFTPSRNDNEKGNFSNDNVATKESSFHNDASQLTDLQRLISEAIILNGGSCHLDVIHDYVLKHWSKLKGRDGQPKSTDCRRAILASLSKNLYSHPLFTRDVKHEGAWKMGSYNPLKNVTHLPPTGTDPPKPNTAESNNLTDLQKLIIRAIGDKKVEFDTMLKFVSQRWQTLRRRDGSQYASNIKRAIQASLSNNSAAIPIFKKEPGDEFGGKGLWCLTERGLELWRQLCEEDEKSKRSSNSSSPTASRPSVNSPNGSGDLSYYGNGSVFEEGCSPPDKGQMEFEETSDDDKSSEQPLPRSPAFLAGAGFQFSQPSPTPLQDVATTTDQNGISQLTKGHS
jgi:protein-disulfide isomerase-like protein with CxxC motif